MRYLYGLIGVFCLYSDVCAEQLYNFIECDVWGGVTNTGDREDSFHATMLSIRATKDLIASDNMSVSLFSKGTVSPMGSADSLFDNIASISLGGRIKVHILYTAVLGLRVSCDYGLYNLMPHTTVQRILVCSDTYVQLMNRISYVTVLGSLPVRETIFQGQNVYANPDVLKQRASLGMLPMVGEIHIGQQIISNFWLKGAVGVEAYIIDRTNVRVDSFVNFGMRYYLKNAPFYIEANLDVSNDGRSVISISSGICNLYQGTEHETEHENVELRRFMIEDIINDVRSSVIRHVLSVSQNDNSNNLLNSVVNAKNNMVASINGAINWGKEIYDTAQILDEDILSAAPVFDSLNLDDNSIE